MFAQAARYTVASGTGTSTTAPPAPWPSRRARYATGKQSVPCIPTLMVAGINGEASLQASVQGLTSAPKRLCPPSSAMSVVRIASAISSAVHGSYLFSCPFCLIFRSYPSAQEGH